MTENRPRETADLTMDDLLDNPFDLKPQTSLLPDEMANQAPAKPGVKLMERLSEEEQQKARDLAKQIPEGNYEAIITYGANAQNQLSTFSHKMLDHVQSKDIGPVGDVLKDLMGKLNEIDPEDLSVEKKTGIRKWFGRVQKSVQELMTKYQKLSTQIDRIGIQLEHAKRGLIEDVQMLDQLYDQNKAYFQVLNVYIAAA